MKLTTHTHARIPGTQRAKAQQPHTKAPESGKLDADLVVVSELPTSPAGAAPEKVQALRNQSLSTTMEVGASATLPATVATPVVSSFKAGFVDGYLTPKEIRGRCEKLAKEFPHLVELVDTGIMTNGYDGKEKSVQGPSELFYLRLGPRNVDRDKKVGVFQFAAAHARERVNPMSMMELAEQLAHNYDPTSSDPKVKTNTQVMDDLDIFIAINTNPDGHNYAAYDDPMWRKNRRPNPDAPGKVGVDVNRNYPYQWERSDRPGSQTYSGTGPASEPETQALLAVTKNHPNIMFVVDWHSYGQEIRRPMGVSLSDKDVYDEMHGRVQHAMKEVGGSQYDVVVSQVTKGSSDDHFYHVENVYSTVMETGLEFTPPEHEALQVKEESVAGAREFLEIARDYQNSL